MGEGRRRAPRISVSLQCTACGSRNYKANKPRREGVKVLVLRKYCKTCNRHTEHREGS